MGKKRRDPPVPENAENSTSATVFGSLFGDSREQITGNSLFSESNPFRRKKVEQPPDDPRIDLGLGDKDAKGGNLGTLGTEVKDMNGKADGKREISDLQIEVVEKTNKKLKGHRENHARDETESTQKGVGHILENSNISTDNLEVKKRKKRKRDELEAEYDSKHYGVVSEEIENPEKSTKVGQKRKTIDNPEDLVVPKESFDDESKLRKTIFVGNLPLTMKKKELKKVFEEYGEIESVRIRSVPIVDGKMPRKGAVITKKFNENGNSVNAYIVFQTEESAQKSLAHNMALVGGNHIRVDAACPPQKKFKGDSSVLYDKKRTVFVGNLPFDVKDEEVYKLFSSLKNLESSIEAIRVIRDPGSSIGKGIAYVLFKTTDDANLVLKKRNLKIRDRELRFSHTKSMENSLKRKNSSSQPEAIPKRPAIASYQGLRASKSGSLGKNPSRANPRSQPTPEPKAWTKVRTNKRPAVAARKEKAKLAANTSRAAAGWKRKHADRNPQSSGKKKTKKFK